VNLSIKDQNYNSDFNVIQLSTSFKGGAALAARRLNSDLNRNNIESKFFTISKNRFIPNPYEFEISRTLKEKISSGSYSIISKVISKKTPFSLFSSNLLSMKKVIEIMEDNNTILHIHNWFNLINQAQIINLAKRKFPIVVTLHDQRFFTGGCHVSYNCSNFQRSCELCPELPIFLNSIPNSNFIKNLNLLENNFQNLKFIAPSKWMLEQAKKSTLLKNSDVRFIPNTLGNFKIFGKKKKITHTNWIRVGVASVDNSLYLKGGDIIERIQEIINHQKLNIKIFFLSDIKEEYENYKFWDSIDILLVTSRAENSPNVIHEAKSIGIPVMASNVGGIKELLHPKHDYLIELENLNANFIIDSIHNINKDFTAKDSKEIIEHFKRYAEKSVSEHIDLYKEITKLVN